MSKSKSGLPLKGTYNGINYYFLNGKQTQRVSGGGFTSESIKKSPNMQVVRDSNSELSLCSKFVKELKVALFPFLDGIKDGTLHSRIMQVCMAIKKLDEVSGNGKRTVGKGLQTAAGKKILGAFAFTPQANVGGLLGQVRYHIRDFSLEVMDCNPSKIKFAKGATHFVLQYAVLVYNIKQNYFSVYAAEPLVRQKGEAGEQLMLKPVEAIEKMPHTLYIPVSGIRFYEFLNEKVYSLYSKEAIGVEVMWNYEK